MANNPLRQFFRQPSIYINLPSNGDYYPEGEIDIPESGELPVYPMTAIDEITYRTPDALYNGTAVVNVVQSCIPAIKNAWHMPAMDIDNVLVAIRIASYGHELDIDTKCPACENASEFTLDLRTVIDNFQPGNYQTASVKSGDLEIFFRPLTYQMLNENNAKQFNEQRILQAVPNADNMDEEQKIEMLSQALKSITALTVNALSMSIAAIKTPDSLVTEREFIEEFLNSCDRKLFTKIRELVVKLKTSSELKPLNVKCPECEHEYSQAFTLDMVSFFDPAS